MPVNITFKDVPDELVRLLKERAKRNHRSLQKEILALLEEALKPRPLSIEEAYERLKALGLFTPDEAAVFVRADRDGR